MPTLTISSDGTPQTSEVPCACCEPPTCCTAGLWSFSDDSEVQVTDLDLTAGTPNGNTCLCSLTNQTATLAYRSCAAGTGSETGKTVALWSLIPIGSELTSPITQTCSFPTAGTVYYLQIVVRCVGNTDGTGTPVWSFGVAWYRDFGGSPVFAYSVASGFGFTYTPVTGGDATGFTSSGNAPGLNGAGCGISGGMATYSLTVAVDNNRCCKCGDGTGDGVPTSDGTANTATDNLCTALQDDDCPI